MYIQDLLYRIAVWQNDEERMKYRGSSFYDTMNCKVILEGKP